MKYKYLILVVPILLLLSGSMVSADLTKEWKQPATNTTYETYKDTITMDITLNWNATTDKPTKIQYILVDESIDTTFTTYYTIGELIEVDGGYNYIPSEGSNALNVNKAPTLGFSKEYLNATDTKTLRTLVKTGSPIENNSGEYGYISIEVTKENGNVVTYTKDLTSTLPDSEIKFNKDSYTVESDVILQKIVATANNKTIVNKTYSFGGWRKTTATLYNSFKEYDEVQLNATDFNGNEFNTTVTVDEKPINYIREEQLDKHAYESGGKLRDLFTTFFSGIVGGLLLSMALVFTLIIVGTWNANLITGSLAILTVGLTYFGVYPSWLGLLIVIGVGVWYGTKIVPHVVGGDMDGT